MPNNNKKIANLAKRLYTSKEFNKRLKENGCDLMGIPCFWDDKTNIQYYEYDILWHICVEFKKEFFGSEMIQKEHGMQPVFHFVASQILFKLQIKTSLKEIEKYIWEHCLFNPKNKGQNEHK